MASIKKKWIQVGFNADFELAVFDKSYYEKHSILKQMIVDGINMNTMSLVYYVYTLSQGVNY